MEKDKLIRLKLVGFDDYDAEKFFAIFDLAERGLKQSWLVVDSETADFFLFAAGESAATGSFLFERCLFYTHSETASEDNQLLVDAKKVPRLRALIALFNRVALAVLEEDSALLAAIFPDDSHQNSVIELTAEPITIEAVDAFVAVDTPETSDELEENEIIQVDSVFFHPEQALLAHLPHTKTQPFGLPFKTHIECSGMYVYRMQPVFYCGLTLEQLSPHFDSPLECIEKRLTEAERAAIITRLSLWAQPLSELSWYTAFTSSQARWMQGHLGSDRVYLSRLPNMDITDEKKLALLNNDAVSGVAAATETGTQMVLVYDFYNARQLAELIEKSAEIKVHQKNPSAERLSLFTRIGNRLRKTLS